MRTTWVSEVTGEVYRSFWALERECDGGYWARDEETGEETVLTRNDLVGDYICD